MQNPYPEPSDDGACPRLVDALLHYSGASAFDELLMPWIDSHPGEVAWLASFADRSGEPIPHATLEERWRLYALGRLCELLCQAAYTQLPFRLSDKQFHAFTERLGLDTSGPGTYSPFYHEVVKVLPARDPRQAPCLLAEEWPCLMLGDLLLMRAGVLVDAGEDTLRPVSRTPRPCTGPTSAKGGQPMTSRTAGAAIRHGAAHSVAITTSAIPSTSMLMEQSTSQPSIRKPVTNMA